MTAAAAVVLWCAACGLAGYLIGAWIDDLRGRE
jgi:hypothetical protein